VTNTNLASACAGLKDETVLRTDLDRIAEESSENEGMAEHAQKALDPIKWEKSRIQRSNDGCNAVSTWTIIKAWWCHYWSALRAIADRPSVL
jgi:hypothetical protein